MSACCAVPHAAELPVDVLAALVDLVDHGICTPMCLFAQPETTDECLCTCDGSYHAAARPPEP